MRRFGFSGKRKQRRRQLIAWAFNLLILILACGWLLLNLLINPERYAGSLSVAGMTDDEWRRTIIITALSSLPTSFLLIDGLKCTIHVCCTSPQVLRRCMPWGTRRRRIIELIVRSVT